MVILTLVLIGELELTVIMLVHLLIFFMGENQIFLTFVDMRFLRLSSTTSSSKSVGIPGQICA